MRSRRLVFKSTRDKEEQKSCNGEKSEPEVLTVSSSYEDGEEEEEEEEGEEEQEVPVIEEEEEEEEEEKEVQEEEEEEKEEVIEETRSPGASNLHSNKPKKEKNKKNHRLQQQHQQRRGQQNGNVDSGGKKNSKKGKGLYNFPMHRVSRIIKSEGPDLRITHEAVFLINKASEKFLDLLCEDTYAYSVQGRKNYVAYNNLSSVVRKRRRFDFLSDFVPEKIKAEDALAERKKAET
ncbi:DNA polymerase II subunit B3-1-like [Malania oleifera]|uniref:DNA polymerase II subunit B3-1-like n=1 Tax=Malania oleifera TaxID=397392 RepID=UPI0025AE1482|nr:DNA polymerase II subunit B3-1-like [Malania oleifera]